MSRIDALQEPPSKPLSVLVDDQAPCFLPSRGLVPSLMSSRRYVFVTQLVQL